MGEGAFDLVFVPTFANLVFPWLNRDWKAFYDRLASFTRLIMLDKRGTGLSDRPRDLGSLEARMDDIRAVLDAIGAERAVLVGAGGAIEQVNSSVTAMFETLGALFARHSDIKPQHLGGAVKIMDVYYRLFNSEQGWRLAIWFSVLMNVNLALLNMLPIPVLDGGHILLAVIEGIRRKPISARVINAIQTSCAVLLIGFMLYIAFYDVQDLPWKRSKEKPAEVRFPPKSDKN